MLEIFRLIPSRVSSEHAAGTPAPDGATPDQPYYTVHYDLVLATTEEAH
ncbi:hypothetical protein EV643_108272 [Kribbella sp. VKM Ac-2527]|jgi:hydroxyquinol 1,2-dioxygenase|uniref:Uncharacterized protein n=1 Tax=Kribbella caucasensis TaxID=2512215 RepID=A0A4R6KGA2_9ACTN|nr:hypothetical protein EV643_108272 [Kribbella sp. VKM Ac-2527]